MRQTERRHESDVKDRRIRRQRVNNEQLRARYERRRKKRKRQIFAARSIVMFMICLDLIFIILFMTPLFNIRRITISGNNVISLEEINSYVGDLNGENILKVSEDEVSSRLSNIAYIKEVSINKNYLKTTLDIYIVERVACGCIEESGVYLLFDDEGVILAQSNEKPEGIPLVIAHTDENAKNDIKIGEPTATVLTDSLKLMRQLGILEGVDNFNLTDLSDITFTYSDRLDVSCGSDIDLDRKLRLFEAMVNNNNLADNAQGIVDLSVTGNARYSPDRVKPQEEVTEKTGQFEETKEAEEEDTNEDEQNEQKDEE